MVESKNILPICDGLVVQTDLIVHQQRKIAHLDDGCQFKSNHLSVGHRHEQDHQVTPHYYVGQYLRYFVGLVVAVRVYYCWKLVGRLHVPGRTYRGNRKGLRGVRGSYIHGQVLLLKILGVVHLYYHLACGRVDVDLGDGDPGVIGKADPGPKILRSVVEGGEDMGGQMTIGEGH